MRQIRICTLCLISSLFYTLWRLCPFQFKKFPLAYCGYTVEFLGTSTLGMHQIPQKVHNICCCYQSVLYISSADYYEGRRSIKLYYNQPWLRSTWSTEWNAAWIRDEIKKWKPLENVPLPSHVYHPVWRHKELIVIQDNSVSTVMMAISQTTDDHFANFYVLKRHIEKLKTFYEMRLLKLVSDKRNRPCSSQCIYFCGNILLFLSQKS